MGVIAVAEHGDTDQVGWRRILPNLGVDTFQVDPLVEPAPYSVVTSIGNEVREVADVFVFTRFQLIALDHLQGAHLAAVG